MTRTASRLRPSRAQAIIAAAATAWRSLRDCAAYAPRWLAVAVVLQVVSSVVPSTEVWLLKHLVTAVDEVARGDGATQPVWWLVAAMTVVVGMTQPLANIASSTTLRMEIRLTQHYTTTLAHTAARLRPAQLSDPKVIADLARAEQAVFPLSFAPDDVLSLGGSTLTAAALCVTICSMNLTAGLLVIAALLPTLIAYTFIARIEEREYPKLAKYDHRSGYLNWQLLQKDTGTELAMLGSGPKMADLVTDLQHKRMLIYDNIIRVRTHWQTGAALGTALVLAAALAAVVSMSTTGGVVAAAIAGVLAALGAVQSVGHTLGTIVTATTHADAFRAATSLAPASDGPPAQVVGSVETLRLENLTVTYPGAAKPAVENVNLDVRRGDIIALVGANGAGKTTTINAILGSVVPTHGRVLIDDTDAATKPEAWRLARIGLLTQDYGCYELTVRDTITLGTPDSDLPDEQIHQAVRAARAHHVLAGLPDGLDTQLGEQWEGTGLSGGQWQRFALARIALRSAGIWILDEPTSAIDAEGEREVFAELQANRQDRITIVVSHRAWTLRGMDRIYVFNDGYIVQTGTYDELLNSPGRFAELFADQVP